MEPITESDLDSLALGSLAERMDAFLLQSELERYGNFSPLSPFPIVSDILKTNQIFQKSEAERRRIAYLCFNFLVQVQMLSVASGMTNKILYTSSYTEKDWCSPVFRLREGALRQCETIGSRIAFEIFIDLLYFIETGKRLETKKSKIGAFRTWLKNVENRFHYFFHVLLAAYRFDRQLRTPEVHGSSRLPRRFLTLQIPTFEELNEHFKLTNTLMHVWRPLIDILNGVRPTYMHIAEAEEEWFHVYLSGNDDEIEEKLNQILLLD